jgi:hypothetical protein
MSTQNDPNANPDVDPNEVPEPYRNPQVEDTDEGAKKDRKAKGVEGDDQAKR